MRQVEKSSNKNQPFFKVSKQKMTDLLQYIINFLDLQSCTQLRNEINSRCGPRPSTSNNMEFILNRDLQKRGTSISNPRTVARVLNSHLPNQKRRVDRVATKSFCTQYIQNGTKIVVASQGEIFLIRIPKKTI